MAEADAPMDRPAGERVVRPATPGWRQTLAYLRDPFGAVERWAEAGDVVHLDLFTDDGVYLVTDPGIVRAVLTTREGQFRKGAVRRRKFQRVLGEGVHDAPRGLWERTQPIIAPLFGYQRVADAAGELYDTVRAAADGVAADDEPLDAAEFSERLTLDLLAKYVFGADLPAELRELVLSGGDLVMAEFRPGYGSLLPPWVPTPRRLRLKRLLDRVEEYLDGHIEAVLDGAAADEYVEFLHGADPELFDPGQIRDEYITIVAAGHRTTSTALTAGLGVLARDQDVAARLRTDVADLVEEYGSVPAAAVEGDIEGRYLGGFIREVLRLYPPSPHIMRDALAPVEIDGVRFPEGATVWMPQWVLHRDPRFWADPAAFRPGRWTEGAASGDDDSYIPFGAGPRRCLGQYLADMEMQLVFAEMVRRFAFDPATDEPIDVEPSLTTVVTAGSELLVRPR
ncbi:MAG: cytochrome P450 [Halobacteriaceae archaeon]